MEHLDKKKKTILYITIITITAAVAYALITPSVYKAEAFLLPPNHINVQRMNMQGNLKSYTNESVYQTFISTFKSKGQRQSYFQQQNLQDRYCEATAGVSEKNSISKCATAAFEAFDKNLQIALPKKQNELSEITASFEFNDAELSAQHLNNYIAMVRAQTIDSIYNELDNQIKLMVRDIKNNIESRQNMASTRTMNEIAQLNEEIAIAKIMGIKRPDDLTDKSKSLVLAQSQNSGLPIEFLGYDYLEAKRDKLLKRKDFAPFISGLSELQETLKAITSVKIDKQSFDIVNIDQKAETPLNRIKPKRSLIVIFGAILGLMLGIFAAFIQYTIQSHREKLATTPN
jgi:chain length determinant protein (polysaccharide antigen chain regulator)